MPDNILVPTTELEAVNIMLENIGEAPVDTLTDPTNADVLAAMRFLEESSRAVQKKGWRWNTDINMALSKEIDGTINVPSNALRVDTMGGSAHIDVVVRGAKLRWRNPPNLNGSTNDFTDATVDLKFEIVWGLKFSELPESGRYYITIRAARMFAHRQLGDADTDRFTADDEARAWNDLVSEEAEDADYNILNNDVAMQVVSGHGYVNPRG